jgi:hypothetical protein
MNTAAKVAKLRKMAEDKSLPQDVRNTYLDEAVKLEEKAAKGAGVKMAKGGAVKAPAKAAPKKMAVGGAVQMARMAQAGPTQQASPMTATRQVPQAKQASPMMTAAQQQQMNQGKAAAIGGRPGRTTPKLPPMREEPARYKPTPSVLARPASTNAMTPQQQVAQNDAKQVAADQALRASMMAKGGVVKKPAGKTMMAKGGAVKKAKK